MVSPSYAEIAVCEAETQSCFGLAVVRAALASRGLGVVPWSASWPGRILCSVYWPTMILDLVRWMRETGTLGSRIMVGGNAATANPAAWLPWVDRVYLGDGDEWDGQWDGPNIVDASSGPAERAIAPIRPVVYADKQRRAVSFVEISRGCKNRCNFCQYGWLKPYRELDYSDIAALIARRETKTIRVFAADRYVHSQIDAIRGLLDSLKSWDSGSDVTVRAILRDPSSLKSIRKTRVGIEGMSERLRKMVGKPLAIEEIVRYLALGREAGIRCFDWYMIYGLPGETDDDAEEWLRLVDACGPVMQGQVLAVHWNAFQPNPLTPMQWCAPAWRYPRERMQRIAEHHVPGMKIMHKPLMTSDAKMLERMVCTRGGLPSQKLVYNLATNRGICEKQPELVRREFERAHGFDCLGVLPGSTALPWDAFVRYDRAKLEAIAKAKGWIDGR